MRHLAWFLLDDVTLAPNDETTFDDIIEFLRSEDIVHDYGLRINILKSKWVEQHVTQNNGTALLGSWVGGPADDSSAGAHIIANAVSLLEERLACTEFLSLQERLLLLRFCYFPTIVYALRTLVSPALRDSTELCRST